jgi:tetratricopeptide (TPR) repeat protein
MALMWAVPAVAEPRWIRIQSRHFEVYSSAGERATRDTVKYFEQVRGFFADAFGTDAKAGQTVRIVIFGSRREYEPYRMNEFATAYYKPGAERDYIVLSEAGLSSYPTATHEYVHLIANHSGMKLPPWLNEGLAELYSTLKPEGNKILVGSLIGGRQRALLEDRWVPLATICGADRQSQYYNEKDKAGALYNEGWALTHMLALSPQYRAGFQQFVKAIMAGLDTEGAMMKAYSRTMKRMDSEVQAYIRQDVFQAVLLPLKLARIEENLPAEPASRFDVRMTLAELSEHPGREKDVAAMLQELVEEFPEQHEVHTALGYAEWRQGRADRARVHFARAYDLGGRSPRFLWDYGRLVKGDNAGRGIAALSALLDLEPARTDARVELAGLQLSTGLKMEARQTLGSVKKVTPELAPRFFQVLAYAELANGYVEESRKAAGRWMETAVSPSEKLAAEKFAASLSKPGPSVAAAMEVEDSPPAIRRVEAPEPQPTAPEPVVQFDGKAEGQFVELQCKGQQAVFVIEVQGALQSYLIDDPLKIVIAGANGGAMGLTCGRQAPKAVKLEFDKPGLGQTAVRGLLRLVDFGG